MCRRDRRRSASKGDLTSDYSLLEAGLERFIRWKKQDFVGKAALEAERARGPAKRFVTMLVDEETYDAPYMSTIWSEDMAVGEVTSAGYGYRVGAMIAFGVVRVDLAVPGQALDVQIFGDRRRAIVQPDLPLWDPENARLRA